MITTQHVICRQVAQPNLYPDMFTSFNLLLIYVLLLGLGADNS